MNYALLKGSHAEHFNFFLCEETPVASAKVLLGESAELHTVKFLYTITEMFEDTAHDAVLTRMNLDTHLLLIGVVSVGYIVSLNHTVFQFNTLCYLAKVIKGDILVKEYVIYLLLQEFRVSQLRSQVTIVSEQEHTSSVAVETSYRVDALRASTLHKVHNGFALLRAIAGRNVILWLIEKHIYLLLKSHWLVVELHLISAQHLGAEFRYHLSVDGHYACLYEIICLTTRTNAGIGKELVQTYRCRRVYVALIVLYAFLHGVLCLWVIAWCALTLTVATAIIVIAATLLTIATAGLEVSSLVIIKCYPKTFGHKTTLLPWIVIATTIVLWTIAILWSLTILLALTARLWTLSVFWTLTILLAWLIALLTIC